MENHDQVADDAEKKKSAKFAEMARKAHWAREQNKKKKSEALLLREVIKKEVKGFNPIVFLSKVAHTGHMEHIDPHTGVTVQVRVSESLRAKCASEVADFLYPKIAAVPFEKLDPPNPGDNTPYKVEMVVVDASRPKNPEGATT